MFKIIFLIFLISTTFLSGCGANPITSSLPDKNSEKSVENELAFHIYNAVTDKNELSTIKIKDTISAKNVVNSYLSEFAKIKYISTNSIVENKNDVTIDFNDSVLKLNIGKNAEQYFLGNLADAVLQYCPNVSNIYFTINGSGYSSENIVIDMNIPYKTRK